MKILQIGVKQNVFTFKCSLLLLFKDFAFGKNNQLM